LKTEGSITKAVSDDDSVIITFAKGNCVKVILYVTFEYPLTPVNGVIDGTVMIDAP
jgi:hypothetical protein